MKTITIGINKVNTLNIFEGLKWKECSNKEKEETMKLIKKYKR